MTARTGGGVTALSFIVRRTPEVIPKFIAKFDSSIKVNEHEIGDVDCEIKLDLRLLVPNAERGETELLLAFIEVGQKRILKHPLCETFIFLKWRRIRKFFLFSLLYHAIYVMLFTLLILGIYEKNCPTPVSVTLVDSFETEEEIRAKYCKTPQYVGPVGYVVIFMNALLLAKEFFQVRKPTRLIDRGCLLHFHFIQDEPRFRQLRQILGELDSMDHHLRRIFLCRKYKLCNSTKSNNNNLKFLHSPRRRTHSIREIYKVCPNGSTMWQPLSFFLCGWN